MMKMKTNQQVFDFVATHLFAQGRQAKDIDGSCMYRSPEGNACAVGCLIPDDMYKSEMEFRGVVRLVETAALRGYTVPDLIKDKISLLYKLQQTHDLNQNWESTEAMRKALTTVANHFKLNKNTLETLSFTDGR
jgi:hypothetical protein